MTDLTKEELQEKIEQVKRDMSKHRDTPNSRMIEVLTEYLEYLSDELKNVDKT